MVMTAVLFYRMHLDMGGSPCLHTGCAFKHSPVYNLVKMDAEMPQAISKNPPPPFRG